MDYRALIQNRKSFRAFQDKRVPARDLNKLNQYYQESVRRLFPEVKTQLQIFTTPARTALEGAAG